jgi:hypothetical protein
LVESVFAILGAALSIWDSKEKTKYIDRLIDLKTRYRKEANKPENIRDNAVLDNLRFDIKLLCDSAAARLSNQNEVNK